MNTFLEKTPPVRAYVFYMDVINISYENSHIHTGILYMAAAYLFLKYNVPIDGTLMLAI